MRIRMAAIAAGVLSTMVSMPVAAQQYVGCPDTNSTSSASNNTFPMGFSTEWRFQYMLPASCLGSTPFQILDMAFAQHGSFNSSHPGTYGPFQVRMALTQAPSLTSIFATNLGTSPTEVMNRPSFQWAWVPNTWVDFGLDRKFLYDGTSNLVIEIRYTGGNSASLPKHAENPAGGYRAYTRGTNAYNATTAQSVFTTSLPKTRFTVDYNCVLTATPQVKLGASGAVGVSNTQPGSSYVIASAFGDSFKITIAPGCDIWIDPDGLFTLSTMNIGPFSSYAGTVPASGSYSGTFNVPNINGLVGLRIHHASVTVNPLMCSNTGSTLITP